MRRSSPLDERPTHLATFFHQDFISRAVAKEIIGVGPLPMRVRVILVDFLIIRRLAGNNLPAPPFLVPCLLRCCSGICHHLIAVTEALTMVGSEDRYEE